MKTSKLIAAIAVVTSAFTLPNALAAQEVPDDNSNCNGVWCEVIICGDDGCFAFKFPDPAGDPPPDNNP